MRHSNSTLVGNADKASEETIVNQVAPVIKEESHGNPEHEICPSTLEKIEADIVISDTPTTIELAASKKGNLTIKMTVSTPESKAFPASKDQALSFF